MTEPTTLKIAVVTDDGETIHRHFGRARSYVIVTVQNGQITHREQVDKAAHHNQGHHGGGNVHLHDDDHDHHHGEQAAQRHADMFAPLQGCNVLLSRGMGRGAFSGLNNINVEPIITDIPTIDAAVQAYLDGSIVNHTEKLH